MTKKQLFKKLQSAGIPRKTGNWSDYEISKSVIFRGQFLDVATHEKIISWIAEYCSV